MSKESAEYTKTSWNRRKIVGLMGAAAGGAISAPLLGACSGGSSSSGNQEPAATGKPSGEITVGLYNAGSDSEKVWKHLIAMFEKKNSDVKVKLRSITATSWAGYFDTLVTQMAAGVKFDVIRVATEGQQLFATKGLLQPLDEYIKRDQKEITDYMNDVEPRVLELLKKHENRGGTYYLPPITFNLMAMWCNKTMFDAAGLPLPSNDWTWDDFKSVSNKISQSGKYAMYMNAAYWGGIEPWLISNGTDLLNADWSKETVTTPPGLEAVSLMRDFVASKKSPAPGGKFDQGSAMAKGDLAMFGGGRNPHPEMHQLGFTDKIQIVDWPKGSKKGTVVGWNGFPMMKSSKSKEAAWAFIKFLTTTDALTAYVEGSGSGMPSRRSIADSKVILGSLPEGAKRLYAGLAFSNLVPAPPHENIIETAVIKRLTSILGGSLPVQQGVTELGSDISAALR